MKEQKWFMGLDLSSDRFKGLMAHQTYLSEVQIENRLSHQRDEASRVKELLRCFHEVLASSKVTLDDLSGIGIGVPGLVDSESGTVLFSARLGWKKFPLKRLLEQELGIPILVENDVNLGLYGEACQGAAKGINHVFGLFLVDNGIGGAIIIDGDIYQGPFGYAGEIGHATMNPHGPLCGCGRHGCLEALAGRLVIVSQAVLLASRGQAPHLQMEIGTDLAKVTNQELSRAVAAGDKELEAVIRGAGRWIGVAVSNMINVLNPEVVVLGGGLIAEMPELFLDEAHKAMAEHTLPYLKEHTRIVVGKLKEDAVALGALQAIRELGPGKRKGFGSKGRRTES